MNRQVTVSLPLNVSPEEMPLFEPFLTYELAPQKIKKFRNVFVAHSGFCLNNKGLIRESHHDHPHQLDDYKNEAAHYYYDVADHPEHLITLDDEKTYLLIHHPWFNYYHWLSESVFRLWMVRRQIDQLILVLPDYYKNADFIMGSLEPFKIGNIFFIPNRKSLMVKNLCLPQIKPVCDSYNSKHLKQVGEFYRNYVSSKKGISVARIDKLYISRQFAGRRSVVNEKEILEIVKKYGFTVFHPEHFSFLEQVAIFSNVRYLVGEHGAGLTNLLFMRTGASVLELHKNKTNDLDHPSPVFWYMADALGINYYHQFCETSGKEDYFVGDYLVDVDLFEKNLELMLSPPGS